MADNKKVVEEEKVELTNKEKLAHINTQLESLKATEVACDEILKDKNIRIVNLADTSEDPLALTITGNAVISVIRPIAQGVQSNRNQLVSMKEQLLTLIEKEVTAK